MTDIPTLTETIRVLTLNLLSPSHAYWPRRRNLLRDCLSALRPDVVALQEVVWGNEHDEVHDLLGEEYHVAPHSARSDDGVGAVLASRVPFGAVRELDLHVIPRVDLPWSAAVLAEVALPVPFGPTLFVHYKPTWHVGYAHERELQAVTCARFVDEVAADRDVHVVLLGDLDDTPDSSSVRFWTGRQALDGSSVAYRDGPPRRARTHLHTNKSADHRR